MGTCQSEVVEKMTKSTDTDDIINDPTLFRHEAYHFLQLASCLGMKETGRLPA